MRKHHFSIWQIISCAIAFTFLLFIVYPMFTVFKNSIYENGRYSFAHFRRFFGEYYYVSTLFNSIKVAVAVAICSLILGIPLAYFNTVYTLHGSTALQIIIILCSMSAPFVGAYSWILLFGRGGTVTRFMGSLGIAMPSIYGFYGLILVMTTKMFPLVYMYVSGALKNIDSTLLEASESMGCTGLQRFIKIIIQLCMPSVLAVTMMVFMRSMADFGTPLLIGEGYRTFSVEIYKQYMGEGGVSHGFASAISVIAVAITGLFFFIQRFLARKFSFKMDALHPIQKKKAPLLQNVFMHFFAYLIVAFSFLPQLYLIYTSFRKTSRSGTDFISGYSFRSYELFFQRQGNAISTTLFIGLVILVITVSLSVTLAYLVVRHRSKINDFIDMLSMLPYIIPGSVIGISLALSFNQKPLALTGTVIIMIIAITVRRMPYTIRSSVANLQHIPIVVEEAAKSLGATEMKTFLHITVPMMKNGIIAGAILSWITILTELSSSIILYSSKAVTLTLSTYIFVTRGNYGAAAASATILTMFTTISLLLFFKITKSKDLTL